MLTTQSLQEEGKLNAVFVTLPPAKGDSGHWSRRALSARSWPSDDFPPHHDGHFKQRLSAALQIPSRGAGPIRKGRSERSEEGGGRSGTPQVLGGGEGSSWIADGSGSSTLGPSGGPRRVNTDSGSEGPCVERPGGGSGECRDDLAREDGRPGHGVKERLDESVQGRVLQGRGSRSAGPVTNGRGEPNPCVDAASRKRSLARGKGRPVRTFGGRRWSGHSPGEFLRWVEAANSPW